MNRYRKLTYGGLLGALIFLGTYILSFPMINGYLNMGDGFILISAVILGPFAAVPAAIGSMLADFSAGFAIYAPFTFIVKGLVGFIPGFLLKGKKLSLKTIIIPFIIAELVMVAGYFLADSILFQAGAYGALPFNLLQGFFGLMIGSAGAIVAIKSKIKRF